MEETNPECLSINKDSWANLEPFTARHTSF